MIKYGYQIISKLKAQLKKKEPYRPIYRSDILGLYIRVILQISFDMHIK